ncbi:MAG: response regulator [Proteobacteria bacterium]|nr:response regulator [Pseudomonadota bacterium]MBU1649222.1 response regulator [Pseudomonadota bacterium]
METNKARILCVDDESINIKLLEAILEPQGYEVIGATSGQEAWERLQALPIDLVLLDVMMPGMNGFDVCRQIKGSEELRDIPVVMITALSSKNDRILGIEAGADDYLTKPFDRAEVLARVKMLVKVKALNDQLNNGYKTILGMTSSARQLIQRFEPLDFDLLDKMDGLVGQIIGQHDEMRDRPRTMLVHAPNSAGKSCWYRYEVVAGKLTRTSLALEIPLEFSAEREEIFFYNQPEHGEIEGKHRGCLEKLRAFELPIINLVCYLGSSICVVAINYGREVTRYDASVIESLVTQTLFLKSIAGQISETEDAFTYTVHALARASEANDENTGNHILRVGEYCALIADRIGMSDQFVSIIRLQALMHDVGKIHIHPDILKKPDKLTDEEFAQIRLHPLYGAKILGSHPRLTMAAEIALSHHERWDGGGYPNRLAGQQIPISGRIMNLADQYDAMRNARVYKPAFDHAKTCTILIEGDGRTMPGHFDPQVLAVFRENAAEFDAIYERLKG